MSELKVFFVLVVVLEFPPKIEDEDEDDDEDDKIKPSASLRPRPAPPAGIFARCLD